MANKAIKYRLYPTTEQSVIFTKTFGCCRKVYNLMLSDKIDGYKLTGKFLTVTPAKYKKDYPYLKEVDSLALANKQIDLQAAFRNRFSKSRKKNTGFPKFKSAKLDNGYGMFLSMLEYKLYDRNKYFVKVDKWFPSSQICHCCGTLHPEMKNLAIRKIICDCGLRISRDQNAAINILNEGLRLLS